MSDTRTQRFELESLPINSVRVTVKGGPDAGKVACSKDGVLTVGTATDNDLVLTDGTVSRYHLELRCHGGEIRLVDQGSTNGTYEGVVRIERGVVPLGATLKAGRTTLTVDDEAPSQVELVQGSDLGALKGRSMAMRRVMALVARAAAADVPVLITGESGTGKELVAQAVHDEGPRADGPFITVDCGALAPNLVATELFGHEKGAFTGAEGQHAGAFERAHGGTLFLDEIGELPLSLQPTLLGVLERKRFRRVGGRAELSADVRIVAATHRDLRAEVNATRFRLDLYYRLAVLKIEVPPLRERAEDVPLLVAHFAERLGGKAPAFAPELMHRLGAARWPGNVRALRNFVEASVALGEVASLDEAGELATVAPPAGAALGFEKLHALSYGQARAALLDDFEKSYLKALLERCQGNVAQASRVGDLNRSHLHELIRKHRLK